MISLFLTAAVGAALQQVSEGQKAPEVTVYNQGFGLVKEIRRIDFKKGRQNVSVTDVPQLIDTTSVAIKDLTNPGAFEILEQNYQYDLVNAQAILNKAVGQRIRLIRHFGSQLETMEGVLMSAPFAITGNAEGGSTWNYNGMVLKLDDGHIVLNPSGEVEVLSIPEGMISVPTLVWDIDSKDAGSRFVELSYITQGMKWDANYVLTLDDSSKKAALQGWVTLDNQSGATYKDATLKLLAGDVNMARRSFAAPQGRAGGGFGGAGANGFQEQQLFEYHLYTLQRPATIKNKETKQLSLLSAGGVPYRKRLILDALRDYGVYYPSQGEIGSGTQHAQARIEFVNDEKSGLGIPLPAGKFRIYQRDASGSMQLLGEDTIKHTPREERISLVVGEAFDIVSNRKRTNFQMVSPNSYRETFEIDVRNRKATTETVEVLERHYGDWKVEATSDPWTKEDATTMRYVLTMKPNEEKKVSYTIVTTW